MHHISMYCHKIDFSVIHTSLESFICRFMIVCVCVWIQKDFVFCWTETFYVAKYVKSRHLNVEHTQPHVNTYTMIDACILYWLLSIYCATIIMYNVLEVLFETPNWIFWEILWKCSIYLNFVSMSKVTNRSRETVLPLIHMQFGLYVLCE